MVSMGNVWDRTTAVLAGRFGILAWIAFLTLFLPPVIRTGFALLAAGDAPTISVALLSLAIALLLLVLSLWGQLAMLTVATDPQANSADGFAVGARRLPAALGVTIVLGVAISLLAAPIGVALALSGIDMRAIQGGATIDPTTVNGSALAFLAIYGIVLSVLVLVVGVRLALVSPVVLRERRGLGAIARSWRLTRGMTWKLIGVAILFVVVVLVAATATQFVAGTVFRLALGAERLRTAAFLTSIVVAAVSTVFSLIAVTFVGQLYATVTESAAPAP